MSPRYSDAMPMRQTAHPKTVVICPEGSASFFFYFTQAKGLTDKNLNQHYVILLPENSCLKFILLIHRLIIRRSVALSRNISETSGFTLCRFVIGSTKITPFCLFSVHSLIP